MRIIFDDDVKDKPFSYFIKKRPNIIKAFQVDDDFKIYKEGKGFFATGKKGDYIILLQPTEGFYIVEKKTFESYYSPYFIFQSRDNVLSFSEHVANKELMDE
jgi:hypothetical protein|tara:strand:- start:3914 stop:4219 length:306 start_codon:yes stop_codon:yes gene_type:complete